MMVVHSAVPGLGLWLVPLALGSIVRRLDGDVRRVRSRGDTMAVVETFAKLGKKLLGTSNEAAVKRYQPLLRQVAGFEAAMVARDDADLRARSADLRAQVREQGVELTAIQAEAFALVREAADRRLG
ncbi:MAG: hypothetical protein ACYTF0_01675, partial [Planctomycetota bacterium]